MDEAQTRDEALALIRERRAALDACLADVPPERMTAPGVADGWSVRDVLAHIAWWERWLVRVLRGERGALAELAQMRRDDGQQVVDRLNAATYDANRDRPLPEILADARPAYDEALRATASQTEDAFARYRRVVAANTWEHYDEHAEHIRDWLARERGA
jgi:uncharacterized protein (TIGR03083 family)